MVKVRLPAAPVTEIWRLGLLVMKVMASESRSKLGRLLAEGMRKDTEDANPMIRERTLEIAADPTLPFVMPPERSANLDTPMDLEIMEAMLASGRWTVED